MMRLGQTPSLCAIRTHSKIEFGKFEWQLKLIHAHRGRQSESEWVSNMHRPSWEISVFSAAVILSPSVSAREATSNILFACRSTTENLFLATLRIKINVLLCPVRHVSWSHQPNKKKKEAKKGLEIMLQRGLIRSNNKRRLERMAGGQKIR